MRIVEAWKTQVFPNPRHKPGYRAVDLGGQVGHVVHRRANAATTTGSPWWMSRSRRRGANQSTTGEDRRDIVDA